MRWREMLLIGGLFAILIAFTVYGPGRSTNDEFGERGSTYARGSDGALALQRWLDSLGYTTAKLEFTDWQIPDDAAVLFIIAPTQRPIIEDEAEEILRWVRDGGTLIAIDERPQMVLRPNALWRLLNVSATVSETDTFEIAERAEPAQPILSSPLVTSVPVETSGALTPDDPNYVPLLETRFGPTVIGREEGRGYLYLSVSAHPFTNAGLQEPGSGPFVLNLLARVPRNARILFDEYHHGFGSAAAAAPTLRQIVLSRWWGWAGIYTIGVVALYLVLTGRRFGRSVPLKRDVARRSSAEYVQSIAQLLRRGRKRAPIARHYHDTMKRRLARPYGFVPPESDRAFVRELVRVGGATDEQAGKLQRLLDDLSRTDADDAALVRAVQVADGMIDAKGRLR